jgi:hypothetical protein
MGVIYRHFLPETCYSCAYCNTHLATPAQILSKAFVAKNGRAYLFNTVINTSMGDEEERELNTGLHRVADVYCVGCLAKLGWKYLYAHDPSQKYKEGSIILEVILFLSLS